MTSLRERLIVAWENTGVLKLRSEGAFVRTLIDDVVELRELAEWYKAKGIDTLKSGAVLHESDARLKSLGVDVGE